MEYDIDPRQNQRATSEPSPTVEYQSAGEGTEVSSAKQNRDPRSTTQAGDVFGHFRVVAELGHGGMGTVFRAFDESLQRYIALKVVRQEAMTAADSSHVQRLLDEAVAQARLNHPNVLQIYYVGRDQGRPFFAMELVNGPTLALRLASGALPFAEVIEVTAQLVDALRHAAEFDILHGDIKPGNILLVTPTTPKLADFGLARRLSEIPDQSVAISGTPDYLDPESTRGGPINVRSDMYALGVTLFEMTFGQLPFSGDSVMERMRKHAEGQIEFPLVWPESIPKDWRSVLEKLMAKNRDERYADYQSLRKDVLRLRPTTRTKAGRVPRGLAWLIDIGLTNAVLGIFNAPRMIVSFNSFIEKWVVPGLLYALANAVILLAICFLQARWKTTPGKRLFHLRIVDRHGLPPKRKVLAGRMALQLLPFWAGLLQGICSALGLNMLGIIMIALIGVMLLIDIGFALFSRSGRSVHDLICGTRVVVEAGD